MDGAQVHLERVVGDQTAVLDLTAGTDGSWSASGVLGGTYRIRAWRPPDLALTAPLVVFVGATENHGVTLKLTTYSGQEVNGSIAPDPPIVGQEASLLVRVATVSVGADGVVRATPQVGLPVELSAAAGWRIDSNPSGVTSAAGTAVWQLSCDTIGADQLSAAVNGITDTTLTVSACAPVPTTTTSGLPGSPPASGAPPTTAGR